MVSGIKTDLKKYVFKDVEWIDWLGLGFLSDSLTGSVKQDNKHFFPWATLNFFDQIKNRVGLYVECVPRNRFV
jgi:hypothetical protein